MIKLQALHLHTIIWIKKKGVIYKLLKYIGFEFPHM